MRSLVLADLLHQALVLFGQSIVLGLLRFELLLPAGIDGDLLPGTPIGTNQPAEDQADDEQQAQEAQVHDS